MYPLGYEGDNTLSLNLNHLLCFLWLLYFPDILICPFVELDYRFAKSLIIMIFWWIEQGEK